MTGENLADLRVRVEPGDGVVAVLGRALLVVPSVRPGQDEAVEALLAAAVAPGVVRAVARVVADFEQERIPAFSLVVEGDEGGVFALVHGEVVVEAVGPGEELRLAGREARSWVDRELPVPLQRLTVTAQDVPAGPGDAYSDLRAGVVRGGGVLVSRREMPQQEPGPALEQEQGSPPEPWPGLGAQSPARWAPIAAMQSASRPNPLWDPSPPAPGQDATTRATVPGGPELVTRPEPPQPAVVTTQTLTPIEQGLTPVEQTLAPIEQGLAPIEQGLAPIEQTLAPIEQTLAPIEQTLTPIEQGRPLEPPPLPEDAAFGRPLPAPPPPPALAQAVPNDPAAGVPATAVAAATDISDPSPGHPAEDPRGFPDGAPGAGAGLEAGVAAGPEPNWDHGEDGIDEPGDERASVTDRHSDGGDTAAQTPPADDVTDRITDDQASQASPAGEASAVATNGAAYPGRQWEPEHGYARPESAPQPQPVLAPSPFPTQLIGPPAGLSGYGGVAPAPVPAAFDPFGRAGHRPPEDTLLQRDEPGPGRLILQSGPDVLVDRDCVIGRNPEADPDVARGRAKAVVLPDAEQRISRVHARLVLRQGTAVIVDQGSVNGTWIEPPGTEGWIAVSPDLPAPLPLGSRIQVGDAVLSYAASTPA